MNAIVTRHSTPPLAPATRHLHWLPSLATAIRHSPPPLATATRRHSPPPLPGGGRGVGSESYLQDTWAAARCLRWRWWRRSVCECVCACSYSHPWAMLFTVLMTAMARLTHLEENGGRGWEKGHDHQWLTGLYGIFIGRHIDIYA